MGNIGRVKRERILIPEKEPGRIKEPAPVPVPVPEPEPVAVPEKVPA